MFQCMQVLQCVVSLQCGAAQWCCSAMLQCGVECGEHNLAQVLQRKHVLHCGIAVCREVRGAESRDTHIYQCAYMFMYVYLEALQTAQSILKMTPNCIGLVMSHM